MRLSNIKLESAGVKGTKTRLDLNGRLFVDCTIRSVTAIVRGEPLYRYSREVGMASGNIKRDFDNIKYNAMDNALYNHVRKTGRSGEVVKIHNYWIKYFELADEKISMKRVRIRGKYYSEIRKNGKYYKRERWSSGKILED